MKNKSVLEPKVYNRSFKLWLKFVRDRKGATAIEYGLMAALIGVAIIGGARTLGSNVSMKFRCAASSVASTTPGEKPRVICLQSKPRPVFLPVSQPRES